MIEFFIPCSPPKTGKKNSKRAFVAGGRAVVVKSEKAIEAEATWHDLLKDHVPELRIEGPIRFSIEFTFPLTAADTKTKALRERFEGDQDWVWLPSRPDASNLVEAVQDVMTTLLFWKDDAQVVDLRVQKKRGLRPGVLIKLAEIE